MVCLLCLLALLSTLFVLLPGCAVPQPTGRGSEFLMQEPTGKRQYYLYLPTNYSADKKWPLVLTLHGMRPFDIAPYQRKEWETLADQYGLVIVAPVLSNSDLFMQYPLRDVSASVRRDEDAVIATVNYVVDRCNIDKTRIYATGWSSGGYLLHYIVNRHPDLFAALCARGCCFSETVLSEDNARLMARRKFPIMVYYGENDLAGVRRESDRAIEWYRRLGFTVTNRVIPGKGHERVPDLAAAFFAQSGKPARRIDLVEIETSGSVGVSPFTVNLLANLPGVHYQDYHGYKFSWYIDDQLQDQAQGSGKRMLFATITPIGEHNIKVEVVSPEGRKMVNAIQIRVLPATPKM